MSKLSQWLWVLTHPDYWLRNYPTSKVWDAHLLKLLESHDFVPESRYVARIGGVRVWIANHPYASFAPHEDWGLRALPTRRTADRAMRKYVDDSIKVAIEKAKGE